MRAVRWHARGDVRLEEVPDAPAPRAGEVRLAVSWCGICGTDVEEYTIGPLLIPVDVPNRLTGAQAPLTLGHELSARVVDVGADVRSLAVGDLVAVDGITACGHCWWCRRNQATLCPDMANIGLMFDGGLADRVTVAASTCVRVPDGVPDDAAALAEPVSVAVRALRRGRLSLGERVVVLGAGTIGLLAVQVARAAGAAEVMAVDPVASRRAAALHLGATAALEPGDDLCDRLRDREGVGPDLAVDATGRPEGPAVAATVVRQGGRAVVVALPTGRTTLDALRLVLSEVELIGSLSHVYDEDFRAAVALIADGRIDVRSLITDRIPLSAAVDRGLHRLLSPERGDVLKILVGPALG